MKIFIIITLLTQSAWAAFMHPDWQQAEYSKVKVSLLRTPALPLVHLKREGAVPVILLHGLSGNAHHWMDFAPDIFGAGYDVLKIERGSLLIYVELFQ